MYETVITRADLARIIAHVEFASKDTTLPVLNAVRIVAEGDTITVSSTDRYVLAESTITVDEWDGEAASATIPAADVTAWKQVAKLNGRFRLTLSGKEWSLDSFPSKASGRSIEADYPKIGGLFPEDRTLHPINPVTLSVTNLDKLGKFARAAGIPTKERHWKIGQSRPEGRTAPLIALIEGTRALIMPIVNYNNAQDAPEGYQISEGTN